jgi:hypothetical protein
VPNEQEAGAIIVALKAQIDSLEKGFAQAKKTLKGFGGDVQASAVTVGAAGKQISTTFDEVDKRSIRMAARFSQITQRMVGLQFAFGALNQLGGRHLGRFSQTVEAGAAGFQAFAAVAATFPTPAGLAIGGILGIGVAVNALTNSFKQAEERADKLKKSMQENFLKASQAQGGNLFKELTAGGETQQIALRIQATEDDLLRTLKQRQVIVNQIAQIESTAAFDAADAEGTRILLVEKRLELEKIAREQPFTATAINIQIAQIDNQLAELEKKVTARANKMATLRAGLSATGNPDDLQKSLKTLNDQLKDSKAMDAYIQGMTDLATEAAGVKAKLEGGFIDPAEAAARSADIAAKKIKLMVDNLELLKRSGNVSGSVEGAIQRAQQQASDAELQKLAQDRANEDDRRLQDREQGSRAEAEALRQIRVEGFNERFTVPFSQAVGFGIADGILSGASAMETLAGVGRNLFANFLDDSIKNFTTGMTKAFEGIAGVGGEVLGSMFTAVIGIAGAIFSNRKNKSSSSFDSVRGQVEDSTPLRGIVAGPSSVAVASVGEDIARAIAPVVDGIRVLAGIMQDVERNTRGGGGRAGGGSDFVAIPTA